MKRLASCTRAVAVIGAIIVSSASPAHGQTSSGPIIDIHMHAYPADFWGVLEPPDPVTGTPAPATDEALLQQTLAAMDQYGIRLGYVSGPLDIVARWKAAAPERFLGGPQFPHPFGFPDLRDLRELHQQGEIAALGEITTEYIGLAPGDEALEPYWALAEALDIPVGIHMSTCAKGLVGAQSDWAPNCRVALGHPTLLEEVLIRHPSLRVWIMHAGFPYLEDTIAIMSVYTNVYADLSGLNWFWPREDFQRYIRRLMDANLGKRLMFGSDQSTWPAITIPRAIETIESATFLSEEEKRDIFCFNAARFLRIDEDICRN